MKVNKPFTLPTAFLLSVLTLFAVSCNTPENYEGEPNVYAMLSTRGESATIMIGLTASISDTLKPDTIMDTFWYEDTFEVFPNIVFLWNGVSGADVSLEHSGTTYETIESSSSRGYYVTDTGLVFEQGDLWKFAAEYPDGKSIQGHTRFPASFEVLSPTKDTVTWFDTLKWSASSAAKGYQIGGQGWGWSITWEGDSVYDTFPFLGYELYPADERAVVFYSFSFGGYLDSVEIYVEALDTNAYDYIYYGHNWWDVDINKDDYMHIESAWGVFGSKTIATSKRYVLRDSIELIPKTSSH